ncbi:MULTISPECIES: fimbria/pilus outer membrane usher protein [unclassified Pseudomonas]|uniref:fimbria/pilus outer membrane usher protein n=1 Tax=unclassified Pseudomonas TaxID=196821 RepID=UPI000BCF79EB|nr:MULTISPECIES: fimbria/pilus outer membrane usher protein [unclassified Pseudomonas]PVZ12624.1 outer membrane usher protein [Pseudomonas sp. URIL14HWK12:I12]PVZ23225.1 outer membrane usher protein [Pseudomonas sp. URIL14HWK12:I10]PVZ32554.1 outer membrane usher protein [Pseudomonas sp. URIL14HWK12:I11]SNZ13656.1 outer membrane usher protein [Pseudomonas sp. URIL14HWK12:I9]
MFISTGTSVRGRWLSPVLLLVVIGTAFAEENADLDFNPTFFNDSRGRAVDVSAFRKGNPVIPGVYKVDVYLNDQWLGQEPLVAKPSRTGGGIYCFSTEQLSRWGVDWKAMAAQAPAGVGQLDTQCVDFAQWPDAARLQVEISDLRADLTIAQAYLLRRSRGEVDPSRWDSGITAGFVNYRASMNQSQGEGMTQSQSYLGLATGLNLGEWRLRHNGGYRAQSRRGVAMAGDYQTINSYAEHDITAWRSQLSLGQYYTPGELFDSVPFIGAQLSSDDRMLPDSQRGFAPQVRGVADGNATVTIRQGNNVLYEKTVPPGPFIIDDLYPTSYAGDLQVSITQANGNVRRFVVPFASVTQLIRPGTSRFSLAAGRHRNDDLSQGPAFAQGTYQRGLSNVVTAYSGSQLADGYASLLLGSAVSTPIGALGLDLTQSRTTGLAQRKADNGNGQSYRLSYSELVNYSKTHFTLAAYRFSSENYLTFNDYAQLRSQADGVAPGRPRSRFQMNIDQPLAEGWGSVYLSGASQNYWAGKRGSDMTYQAGYSNHYRWGGVSLNVSRSQALNGNYQNQYMVSVSLPLGGPRGSGYLNLSSSVRDSRTLSSQVSYSAQAGSRNELNYNVSASNDRQEGVASRSAAVLGQYRASKVNLEAGLSSSSGYRQTNLGASGSLVVHSGGVTFSQSQGDTFALLSAPGAQGAEVDNGLGVNLDRKGYAVVAGLVPYRENRVSLAPRGIANDVELEVSSNVTSPRSGSIVRLDFATRKGTPILLTLTRSDGAMMPVGAPVLDVHGAQLTQLGQGNRLFLRTEKATQTLQVVTGDKPGQRCIAEVDIPQPAGQQATGYIQLSTTCHAP